MSHRTSFYLEPGSVPVCPDDKAVSQDGRVFVVYADDSTSRRGEERFVGYLASPEEFAGRRKVVILSPGNGQIVPVRIEEEETC